MTPRQRPDDEVSDLRISVIGTGYLGATHAACLAELGFDVIGVDHDRAKIARLARGSLPFSEPGLPELLDRHVRSGRLRFTTDAREAARTADVHFVCVGTPQSQDGLAADVSGVLDTVRSLGPHLGRDCLVVGKYTVPVGTAQRLARLLESLAPPRISAGLAWNPEFLREGHAVADTLRPDRLVFGVTSPDAELTLRRVYANPIAAGVRVHVTDCATAELAKVSANAFLATKISFINALAEVSERTGADVVGLADILGDDSRIGRRFLDAGIGFGGGCLPKDVRALSARATELGVPGLADLLDRVDAINLDARSRAVKTARDLCGHDLRGRRAAVLGAAFKPLSDDVRDSPALDVAARLHAEGATVRVYDPQAAANAARVMPQLVHPATLEETLSGADVVLHLTEWPEFRELDPHRAAGLVRSPRLVDGRNRLDSERWRTAGWTVRSLGRPPVEAVPSARRVATADRAPAGPRDEFAAAAGSGQRGLHEWT